MKIYILRHEDRTMDATFFSPLTITGHQNSVKLVKYLNNININKIYSSPFIRTLQTIHPYIKEKNKIKINLEHSLCEIQHPHIIPEKSYKICLPIYIAESFNYNPKYKSFLQSEDLEYPENESIVKNRVKDFLKKLINENLENKTNILLVTHQIVCNIILQIVSKEFDDMNIKIDKNYPTGSLTLVFDTDKWDYKKINW
jgi:broad specificity phosphatase PhoE